MLPADGPRSDAQPRPTAWSGIRRQHVRAVSPGRIAESRGNVEATVLTRVRETIALILDLP